MRTSPPPSSQRSGLAAASPPCQDKEPSRTLAPWKIRRPPGPFRAAVLQLGRLRAGSAGLACRRRPPAATLLSHPGRGARAGGALRKVAAAASRKWKKARFARPCYNCVTTAPSGLGRRPTQAGLHRGIHDTRRMRRKRGARPRVAARWGVWNASNVVAGRSSTQKSRGARARRPECAPRRRPPQWEPEPSRARPKATGRLPSEAAPAVHMVHVCVCVLQSACATGRNCARCSRRACRGQKRAWRAGAQPRSEGAARQAMGGGLNGGPASKRVGARAW